MTAFIIILILGFFILIKGSSIFVDALSSIAINFKVPKMLIGLTIAAFGTCTPELSISFSSMLKNNENIVIGNVLGSCIVNILFIIGLAAIFFPIKIKNQYIKKEIPLHFLFLFLFSFILIFNLFCNNILLSRLDGILFLFLFLLFVIYLVSLSKNKIEELNLKPKYSVKMSILLVLSCILLIIIGSDLIVESAIYIAKYLKISEKFITMTIIVIGTSLPELMMTVIAARKREFEISIGNIIGTNIFNIGIVLGLPLVIFGGINSNSFHYVDFIVLCLSGFLLYVFSKNDRLISKKEGFILMFIFLMYYSYLAIF